MAHINSYLPHVHPKKVFVLSDAPDNPVSPNARDTHRSEMAARLFLPVYQFDAKLPHLDEALWHIPSGEALAIVIGCIPKPEYYQRMYDVLAQKGVRLFLLS